MTDTIDLLEAIGSDAALRHATAGDLANVLEGAQASAALISAVASGDSAMLAAEFGNKVNLATESIQSPAHEEEEEEDGEDPAPDDRPLSLS
ncbi:hypothetical protein DEO45_15350 [Rhodanobacter denitrificans]|uniref:Uncharacterized protein n=1 Tax=Rhodanobacter denitrificans TaxID=666685 RepID=A0A368KA24_9GAMM|nr:hypothetical protein [Rhodanobacter denitrificans]RCS28789.1 hypothetical protein DEO45_15350 [Rhodanobacter denitrificans]